MARQLSILRPVQVPLPCMFPSPEWMSGGCLGGSRDAQVPDDAMPTAKHYQMWASVLKRSLTAKAIKTCQDQIPSHTHEVPAVLGVMVLLLTGRGRKSTNPSDSD